VRVLTIPIVKYILVELKAPAKQKFLSW